MFCNSIDALKMLSADDKMRLTDVADQQFFRIIQSIPSPKAEPFKQWMALFDRKTDQVIKDVFGVSGSDLQEIRSEIAMLQKGELIQKDNLMAAMGLGKSWKKVKVTHLI